MARRSHEPLQNFWTRQDALSSLGNGAIFTAVIGVIRACKVTEPILRFLKMLLIELWRFFRFWGAKAVLTRRLAPAHFPRVLLDDALDAHDKTGPILVDNSHILYCYARHGEKDVLELILFHRTSITQYGTSIS
jgi:hypothetical protein